jgi:hypothetical protein
MFRLALIVLALTLNSIVTAEDKFQPIDIQPYKNHRLVEGTHTGHEDDMEIPPGEHEFGKVKFKIGEGLIMLGSKETVPQMPEKVEGIRVNRRLAKLHLLHATKFGGGPNTSGHWHVDDGTVIGEYRINFEDNTAVIIPIVYGEDVRDWWFIKGEKTTSRGQVVWEAKDDLPTAIRAGRRLYMTTWDNPWPDKLVKTIDYSSKKDLLPTAPICVAITAEDK